MNHPLKLFITYSHKNKEQKEELNDRLAVLEQENKAKIWHDNEIIPGDKWRDKISDNLADSNILLYLVSAHSLASKNCNKELTEALQKKGIRTIPIILEACDWEKHQLSEFQALPTDGHPINEWKPESKAWQDVVEGIRKTVEETLSQMETIRVKKIQEKSQDLAAFQTGNLLTQRGNFLMMLEQTRSAIDAYSQAIKINPNDASAYTNRGIIKDRLELHEKAIEDFDEAIKINPKYAVAYTNKGIAKANLELHKEAIKNFDEAIKINPNDAIAYTNRGVAKAKLGQYEEAIQNHDQAINIIPILANPYYNRGNANFNLKQYKDAIKDYDKAIKINPKSTRAYYRRGTANFNLEQYKEAIKYFDEAININPKFAEAYYNRAIALLCLSKWEDAKADLTTAKNKGADIVGVFQKQFKSVSDFEKKFNVKLPDDIKALLE